MKTDDYIHFRDILIIIAGLLGFAFFFFDYSNHDVKSTASMEFDRSELNLKTDSLLNEIDYQVIDLERELSFRSKSQIIDSLQKSNNRHDLVRNLSEGDESQYPLFYWNLIIGESIVSESGVNRINEPDIEVRYSEDGKLSGFSASNDIVNRQTPFNRKLIRYGMLNGADNQEAEDSVITALLSYQHTDGADGSPLQSITLPSLLNLFNQNVGSMSENRLVDAIWSTADYYLMNSHWADFELKRDSLSFSDDAGIRVATANYTVTDGEFGIPSKLIVEVLPAGSLKKMEVSYPEWQEEGEVNQVRTALLLVLLFAFAVWVLVIFYLRIKAKVIDTRASLVVALLAGFLLPVGVLVQNLVEFNLTLESVSFTFLIGRVIEFGFLGAAGSIVFFAVTAVGDSITRQFWPEKLESFDLIRSGRINNKPIGWVVIRGVSLGLFALGLLSLMLWILPDVVVNSSLNLDGNYVLLKAITSTLLGTTITLFFMLTIFLLIGNQVYAITKQKWWIPVVSALIFGLNQPFNLFDNSLEASILFGVIGFYIGYIYIRTDFLTTVITAMTLLLVLDAEDAWLIQNSAETTVLYVISSFFIILIGGAIYAIIKGEDVNVLPSYIPEYMEEIAAEQRVRQELRIARNVQTSFLPTYIPKLKGYTMAGICEPAQETGGDYYDIIKLDDHSVGIAIGDVSGKGIQAAFYMTFAKGVIHSLCTIFEHPMDMLVKANQLFNDNATRGTFISMIYGILDNEKNTFKFVRAGHNPILIKYKSGDIEWLQPHGMAIGMVKGRSFETCAEELEISMDNVDTMVLYTDGVTEALNKKNEFYGEDRFSELVKTSKTNTPDELIDAIIKDLQKFKGAAEQHDDITCVVVKVQ